jgi:hypothetical protein
MAGLYPLFQVVDSSIHERVDQSSTYSNLHVGFIVII